MDKMQYILEKLNVYNQDHIIKLLEKMNGKEKEALIDQIYKMNLDQIMELYDNTKKELKIKEKKIEPIECIDKEDLTEDEIEELEMLGETAIRKGQYAVVTMAGGQGTRLGHSGPKGTFKLDIYGKGKYLFEILAENLKNANKIYDTSIPWYIMTSKDNNEETAKFLEKHDYFGYNKEDVIIFMQKELPVIDKQGKLLLNKDMKIKEASDGNGGTYSSLRESGCLADMKERGVTRIFIGGVDNVLAKLVDVTLLGMAIKRDVKIAARTVPKTNPYEKVGVFCKINGKPGIVEYAELPETMAVEKDANGNLKYGEAHILCNIYTVDAIEKVSKEPLIYHSAVKKNSFFDINGKEIVPKEANSYKFESFIFDAFEFFDDIALLRGKREDNFAPVKNSDEIGVDCPKTAKELYEKYLENQKKTNFCR